VIPCHLAGVVVDRSLMSVRIRLLMYYLGQLFTHRQLVL
jgi:hypothetical protein